MRDEIRAKCPSCGGESFEWPSSESEPKDDDMVRCIACDARIRIRDLKQMMRSEAEQLIQSRVQKLIDDFNNK